MSFKNYLKFYLKIMPLITIITLSLVTQGYGQSEEEKRIFFEAVKKGDIAQTKKSLEVQLADNENTTQINVDNEDDYNNTALMYAVSNKDIEMINLLLSHGAQIGTEFRVAIYNDDLDIVKIFSEFLYPNSTLGSSYYVQGDSLESLSEYATELGRTEIVKFFKDRGEDLYELKFYRGPGRDLYGGISSGPQELRDYLKMFLETVKKGDTTEVKRLLEIQRLNTQNHLRIRVSRRDKSGKWVEIERDSPAYNTFTVENVFYNKISLMQAVNNRDIEMINLLLSYPAQIDAESDSLGISRTYPLDTANPLTYAVYKDDLDIVELFAKYLYQEYYDEGDTPKYLRNSPTRYELILEQFQYVYKVAKELGRTEIVKYFDDSGYFITEKDQLIGGLTEEKINRYNKTHLPITQADIDQAVSSPPSHSPTNIGKLSPHILSNKSFILYLKKCVDIDLTLDHIDNIVKENPYDYFADATPRAGYIDKKLAEELYDQIIVDQIRFIMDTYNISASGTELAIINIMSWERHREFYPGEKELLDLFFEKGYNPNLITLGERDIFGYDTEFEDYVYRYQVAYNKKEQAKEEEIRKAELKAQKEAAKTTKLAEKEAAKANKLTEKRLAKEAKLAEKEAKKERKRLEKEMKKTAKLTEE